MNLESLLMMIPLIFNAPEQREHLFAIATSFHQFRQIVSIHCKCFTLTNAAPVGAIFASAWIKIFMFEWTHLGIPLSQFDYEMIHFELEMWGTISELWNWFDWIPIEYVSIHWN